jgi:hypothetical protein
VGARHSPSPAERDGTKQRVTSYPFISGGAEARVANPFSIVRMAAIAAAAEQIKARTFTIDGEAVVLGPDGLSRFEDRCFLIKSMIASLPLVQAHRDCRFHHPVNATTPILILITTARQVPSARARILGL